MKLFGLEFGPTDRPAESDLKDVCAAADERLGTDSTFTYSPDTAGEVDVAGLARSSDALAAANDDLLAHAPDGGFETDADNVPSKGARIPW